jgi:hypothetical protein
MSKSTYTALVQGGANALHKFGRTFVPGTVSERIEQFLEEAGNGPECFKCQEPITELNDVRDH